MQFVGRVISSVSDFYKDINPATLSGAIDVIVIEHPDGSFHCTPFHIRFGKLMLLRVEGKAVIDLEVNGKPVPGLQMRVGAAGEGYFVRGIDAQTAVEVKRRASTIAPIHRDGTISPVLTTTEELTTTNEDLIEPVDDVLQGQIEDLTSNTLPYTDTSESPSETIRVKHDDPLLTESGVPSSSLSLTLVDTPADGFSTSSSAPLSPLISPISHAQQDVDSSLPFSNVPLSVVSDRRPTVYTDASSDPLADRAIPTSTDGSPSDATTMPSTSLPSSPPTWTSWIRQLASERMHKSTPTPNTTSVGDVPAHPPSASVTPTSTTPSPSTNTTTTAPRQYVKSLRLTSDEIRRLDLSYGANSIDYVIQSAIDVPLDPSTNNVVSQSSSDSTELQNNSNSNNNNNTNATLSSTTTSTNKNVVLRKKTLVTGHIYLYKWTSRLVVSDVDGTITKSDALGHLFAMVGRDWTHPGVASLYSNILNNGYPLIYLTSRAIGQADRTRFYLKGIDQPGGQRLPDGPLLLSPDRLWRALHREVIIKRPEEFKIACLRDLKRLFPKHVESPFHAGFGNRMTDASAYHAVGIPSSRIFTIDARGTLSVALLSVGYYQRHRSYASLNELVDHVFPPVRVEKEKKNKETKEKEEEEEEEMTLLNDQYADVHYWKAPMATIVNPPLFPSMAAKEDVMLTMSRDVHSVLTLSSPTTTVKDEALSKRENPSIVNTAVQNTETLQPSDGQTVIPKELDEEEAGKKAKKKWLAGRWMKWKKKSVTVQATSETVTANDRTVSASTVDASSAMEEERKRTQRKKRYQVYTYV